MSITKWQQHQRTSLILYKEIQKAGRPQMVWLFHKINISGDMFCNPAPSSLILRYHSQSSYRIARAADLNIRIVGSETKKCKKGNYFLNVLFIQTLLPAYRSSREAEKVFQPRILLLKKKEWIQGGEIVSDTDSHHFICKIAYNINFFSLTQKLCIQIFKNFLVERFILAIHFFFFPF